MASMEAPTSGPVLVPVQEPDVRAGPPRIIKRANRSARQHVSEAQRIRILSAMADLAWHDGAKPVTVSEIVGMAGVSRNTFYALFVDRGDCLLAAIEQAFELARERAISSYVGEDPWVERVRAGLSALLTFFDDEPKLAWLCVVQSVSAGPKALKRRWDVLDQLSTLVDEGREQSRRRPPPLTAQGVVGGAVSLIHARMLKPGSGALTELLNPLMGIIVHPYLGSAASQRELTRAVTGASEDRAATTAALNPLEGLGTRLTYRTVRVLAVISAHPGLSNMEVSQRAGIANQGQISKMLARLTRVGLITNTGEGQARGASNAWRLTRRGEEVKRAVAHEALTPGRLTARGV
jgi:AcrR family transcriptional regulator